MVGNQRCGKRPCKLSNLISWSLFQNTQETVVFICSKSTGYKGLSIPGLHTILSHHHHPLKVVRLPSLSSMEFEPGSQSKQVNLGNSPSSRLTQQPELLLKSSLTVSNNYHWIMFPNLLTHRPEMAIRSHFHLATGEVGWYPAMAVVLFPPPFSLWIVSLKSASVIIKLTHFYLKTATTLLLLQKTRLSHLVRSPDVSGQQFLQSLMGVWEPNSRWGGPQVEEGCSSLQVSFSKVNTF